MANANETIADIIAEKRRQADKIERDCAEKMERGEMISDCFARELVADIRREADRLDAAHKREVDKLNSAIQATVSHSDAEIDRLRREIAETRRAGDAANNWKEICAKCMEGDIEPRYCEYYGEPNGCNSPIYGEHPSTPNAVAMRSCLLKILAEMIDLGGMEAGRKARFSPDAIAEEIRQAFAVPPRNCDRFQTKEDAAMAFNEEGSVFIPQSILWQLGEWLDWLFTPAKEGGAK